MFFFKEEATLSLLSIRSSAKSFHNAFSIGLNKVTNYKTGLKQDTDFKDQVLDS